ncbi:uncharacterized protein [Montipora capricornis]|uniref:uncharacterized protein n=1 Tax=Montipora capricornis TaxID=246305 RepID=UPI0035F15EDE
MPQWVQLPPNLVPEKHTMGKSIYTTDFSSKRPGFQIHLQKAHRYHGSRHHPPVPKKPDRKTMRALQTSDYLDLKEDFERALSTINVDKKRGCVNVDTNTPDNSRSSATVSEKTLLEKFIQPTKELVQEAWQGEATSTKRNRDRLFGLAGQKVPLHNRLERNETKRSPVLPGVNNWLRSSNEYEKAVVYNFMDTLSKATSNPLPGRPAAPKPEEKNLGKPQFSRQLYFQRRAKSACSQRVTDRPRLPPRPKSVGSMRDEEKQEAETENQVVEHTEHARHQHYHHLNHTEGKCEFCDYLRVKRLLEHLNRYGGSHGLGDATLSHLLKPRMDPSHNPTQDDYDYIHDNAFFTNTNARDRGYFIIAPDWVSERKGIMSTHYQ